MMDHVTQSRMDDTLASQQLASPSSDLTTLSENSILRGTSPTPVQVSSPVAIESIETLNPARISDSTLDSMSSELATCPFSMSVGNTDSQTESSDQANHSALEIVPFFNDSLHGASIGTPDSDSAEIYDRLDLSTPEHIINDGFHNAPFAQASVLNTQHDRTNSTIGPRRASIAVFMTTNPCASSASQPSTQVVAPTVDVIAWNPLLVSYHLTLHAWSVLV